MKAKIIKRLLTSALALSLVMAPTMSAFATTTTSGTITSNGSSSGAGTTVVTVKETPKTSSVAGMTTTVSGIYMIESVDGCAVTTDMDAIAQGYGLAAGEKLFAKMTDTDVKKSYLAKACVDAAAEAYGAEVGPCLNIELGKMTAGKYSVLPAEGENITIAIGIPADFVEEGKTYAIVRVRADGVVDILQDLDDNPNTITFDTTAGAGVYAIIKY